jgi:hypothetical protein
MSERFKRQDVLSLEPGQQHQTPKIARRRETRYPLAKMQRIFQVGSWLIARGLLPTLGLLFQYQFSPEAVLKFSDQISISN